MQDKKSMLESLFATEKEDVESEFYKLLSSFSQADKDLALKTELSKPIVWSGLQIYADFLKQHGLSKSSNWVSLFVMYSMKNLISKDRQGRTELLDAIKHSIESVKEKEVTK